MHCLLGVLCGLGLVLVGCQGSGTQGHLTPQAEPAPAVTRQAVDNLLDLYQTALRQADIDRLEALLAPPAAAEAPRVQRQAAAGTVDDVAALRAALSTTFRRRTVTGLDIPADSVQVAPDGRTLTFLEVETTEDPLTLVQQTRLFRTTWGLTQDTQAGTITVRLGTVERAGPLVQVTTPGQVQAGALTRVTVTAPEAPFALAGGTVTVPETGAVQVLTATGDAWHGVVTPPRQPAPQPLHVQLHGARGETLGVQHPYRLRVVGEGVVTRLAGTDQTRLFAVTVAPDGTVWAGGDAGAALYQVAARLTFGPQPGLYQVTVSTPDLPPRTFRATGVAGPPARLRALAGDGAQVTVGTRLSLVVQVSDAVDNPVAGVVVGFRLTTGQGSVAPATAVSGCAVNRACATA